MTLEEPGRVLGAGEVPGVERGGTGWDNRGEQLKQARCESGGKVGS